MTGWILFLCWFLLIQVGLPAKSGVSGAILIVVPKVCGIMVWSPPLDQHGNSVRGMQFCKVINYVGDITRMLTMVLFWWRWWEYCYNPWILKFKSHYFVLTGTCQLLWFSQLWFKGCFIRKKIGPTQEKSWSAGACFVFNFSTGQSPKFQIW